MSRPEEQTALPKTAVHRVIAFYWLETVGQAACLAAGGSTATAQKPSKFDLRTAQYVHRRLHRTIAATKASHALHQLPISHTTAAATHAFSGFPRRPGKARWPGVDHVGAAVGSVTRRADVADRCAHRWHGLPSIAAVAARVGGGGNARPVRPRAASPALAVLLPAPQLLLALHDLHVQLFPVLRYRVLHRGTQCCISLGIMCLSIMVQ